MSPVVFLAALLISVPVAIVLIITAIWYIWESGNTVLYDSLAQKMFGGLENYGLLAIPLFMLTGELMNEGGMTRRLINMARVFVGGFRGGLAYINLLANMFMAAIIGSATAQIAVMSRAMVPAMEEEGYDKGFAAATTAAGGLLAPVIPPSMMFVIFGVLAQIPIGDMFIAGIIPGLMLSVSFALVITVIGWRQNFPKGEWMAAPLAIRACLHAVPALLIPVAIIGGIVFGIATPTESAAIASLIAFLVGWLVYGELRPAQLGEMFKRTAVNASMIIFMIAAASVFGWVIIYEEVPQNLAALITSVTSNPFVFLLIVNLVLLVVGMVIDGIAAIILITPILLPIATESYDISPYQFGVVICLNLVLGLLTPPVGIGLYIASSMSNTSPGAILRALWPFLVAVAVVLVMLSYFEGLSTSLI
ncbi:TRAP transporter large permease [Sulfitobacter sp. M57]|uniref:TRAP transporter large permease n=1 Tax=unclassified Sulfitobacter TaxID=196795 RepID=UPI0023E112D0|nr:MULTISPECIES: TRAP transporter large permease [unclassified Sulfitobacter]MDF3416532.1 TRAP transporter large permease [Sulfitobacter sp. KE5]MDF3424028.1 TRAP transporter large permease [Sulfitobacter sp. KE43]MDF3435014.1 TRAP transporter large permease [Sulfitobacter sp. KE42]MDF3460667.1 TRAP transporter large permease [Sulfitobacter sp. S74]MDF3464621.1 TRAP transporter large permease [Sulfitobacter sp. Ks18]